MGLWDLIGRGDNKHRTLKKVKKHATAKRTTLSKLTKRTLGSGNLRLAVSVPRGEDHSEWLAANTVDFYNELSLLYGLCLDDAAQYNKPGAGFPRGFEYLWSSGGGAKPIRVSAPEYVDYVMTWVEAQLDNEEIFPVYESAQFPPNFEEYIRDIFKRLFRVFAIIYHRHTKCLEQIDAIKHLNTVFKVSEWDE